MPAAQKITTFLWFDDDAEEAIAHHQAIFGGGTTVACGWLKDHFGVSWQVAPRRLVELLADPDRSRAARTMQAMMTMLKIDIAALERAADGH